MELIGQASIEHYLREDTTAEYCGALAKAHRLRALNCQRRLEKFPGKRKIFYTLRADVLALPDGRRHLVEIGGGLTSITARLACNSDYLLVDPLPDHDGIGVPQVVDLASDLRVERQDLLHRNLDQPADIVTANDLFSNVDQRLALFLAWAVAQAWEIRKSLTFHNLPRWYSVQRLDAEKRLSVLAFDGDKTRDALRSYASSISDLQPELFDTIQSSVHADGRQVILLTLKGEA